MVATVGQLFMAGFDGLTVPDDLAVLLRDEQLGGVILFRRNIKSLEQLVALTAQIRDIAGRPLLIAVDHEGGRVFRMPAPFTPVPAMSAVGHSAAIHPESDIVYRLGRMMGEELAAVGININFAPVLDVNTNPDNPIIGDRSFHMDPAIVARLGCRMIRGLLDGGVVPCGKHFPGHGDTALDSHLGLPVISHTWDRLRLFELAPFAAAISEGVPMLMTAHVRYDVIDDRYPATLSSCVIHELLRGEMGYTGVVITDDLQMAGVAGQWPPSGAAIMALAAGCDIALICRDPVVTKMAIRAVGKALAQGLLKEERVAASLERVAKLASAATSPRDRSPISVVGSKQHTDLVAHLARQ